MPTVTLVLDPEKLSNPDLDLRYLIPELLAAKTEGAVEDDGYDYDDHNRMLLFLNVDEVERCLPSIRSFLQTERVLDNDLGSVVVCVEE